MHEREFKRLKQQIEDEYRQKMAALKLVYALSNGSAKKRKSPSESETESPENVSLLSDESVRPNVAKVKSYGNLAKLVRKVVGGLPSEFLTSDVVKKVQETDATAKESSISGALRRMSSKGELNLLEKGKGKKQSKFRKL